MTTHPWRRDVLVLAAIVALVLLSIALGRVSGQHHDAATPAVSTPPGPSGWHAGAALWRTV